MSKLVFWIDVDNTLLDNDHVKKDLDVALRSQLGETLTERFWDIYEQVRAEKDVVDIPATITRLREQTSLAEMDDATYQHVLSIIENFPFPHVLYPQALETLTYLRTIGIPVIVSDGDLSFQAEKIFSSSIAEAVEGKVLLYVHKQEHLQETMQRYPADHYVMIDDKPSILVDTKKVLGNKVTTVFVNQGKYAHAAPPEGFAPDIRVEHIADLQQYQEKDFLL
jgi:FMN phosphatase YigB (HAD superfamily)